MELLRLAYLLNILILLPVCWSMFGSDNRERVVAFEGKVNESAGLRLLVASLWLAILVCSAAGLVYPLRFACILALQVVYKTTYLVSYLWPAYRREGLRAVPLGVTLSFVGIVLAYPLILMQVW